MHGAQRVWVQSLGREDTLEEEMATHSSILDWKIPWTEETDGLQSTGPQRVGRDCVTRQQPRRWSGGELHPGEKPGEWPRFCYSYSPTLWTYSVIILLPMSALLLLIVYEFPEILNSKWTAAHQAPPSMGFSRQQYWSGVPLPSLAWCSSRL